MLTIFFFFFNFKFHWTISMFKVTKLVIWTFNIISNEKVVDWAFIDLTHMVQEIGSESPTINLCNKEG